MKLVSANLKVGNYDYIQMPNGDAYIRFNNLVEIDYVPIPSNLSKYTYVIIGVTAEGVANL